MTTYNFASTGVFVDPLKCDPGELCGICGGRGVYGTPGKACPNCSEKAQNLQAEHVADLERQLAQVTAERDALQESNRQESAAMALLLERECKDGDRLAEALGVPRTEGGSLQVLRMLNAIDALRVDAEKRGKEDGIKLGKFRAWVELLVRFSDKDRQHIATLLAHDWSLSSVEMQSRHGEKPKRITATKDIQHAIESYAKIKAAAIDATRAK